MGWDDEPGPNRPRVPDLAAVRSRAKPVGDGTYRDFRAEDFHHPRRARPDGKHHPSSRAGAHPDAPEGVKGISLFVVPKFMLKADGKPGERNDVSVFPSGTNSVSRGSRQRCWPSGDHGGAIGTLVGAENRGLEYMFIMMNAARFNVGLEGLGDAERAYQRAVGYAGIVSRTEVGVRGGPKVPIIHHPDVRRMLMSMRARIEAMRALAYATAAALDNAHQNPDAAARAQAQAFADLMIPVVRAGVPSSIDIPSLGVQVLAAWATSRKPVLPASAMPASRRSTKEPGHPDQRSDRPQDCPGEGATVNAVIGEMRTAAAGLDGDLALIGVVSLLRSTLEGGFWIVSLPFRQ